jgi:hypothetical protein
MLTEPMAEANGIGTSFYVTPFGHHLSAMHVTTDSALSRWRETAIESTTPHMPLTMLSVIFLASPSSIMVLSR